MCLFKSCYYWVIHIETLSVYGVIFFILASVDNEAMWGLTVRYDCNLEVETGECLLLVLHGFHSTPDQRRERSSEAEFSANRLLHSPNFMMDTYTICTTNYYTSLFVSECQNCAVMSFFNRCGTKPPFGDFLPEDIFVYLSSSLTAAVDIISWHIFHYNWQKEVNRVIPLTFVIVFFSNHHGSLFITLDMTRLLTSHPNAQGSDLYKNGFLSTQVQCVFT